MKKIIIITVMSASIVGCMTSRSPDYGDGKNIQHLSDGKEKKQIAYSINRTASLSTEFDPNSSIMPLQGAWVAPQLPKDIETQFTGVFENSAISLEPIASKKAKDCDITLSIHQQNGFNQLITIPAFIHGLSLFCIPVWGDDVYYLNVIAENKKGLKKEYLIRRSITTTSWLPFIFAMPFSELPTTARNHITLENWKELRAKMEADGFFDKE